MAGTGRSWHEDRPTGHAPIQAPRHRSGSAQTRTPRCDAAARGRSREFARALFALQAIWREQRGHAVHVSPHNGTEWFPACGENQGRRAADRHRAGRSHPRTGGLGSGGHGGKPESRQPESLPCHTARPVVARGRCGQRGLQGRQRAVGAASRCASRHGRRRHAAASQQ